MALDLRTRIRSISGPGITVKNSSTKSVATGLLILALTIGALVAWFGGGVKTQLWSTLPEKSGTLSQCESIVCDEVKCADNERSVLSPGACCPRCVPNTQPQRTAPDCSAVQCESCPADTRAEQVIGQCCPLCRSQDNAACDAGRLEYKAQLTELEAELNACSSDDDCIVAAYSDSCRYVCPSPVNKQALGKVVEKLRSLSNKYCDSCAQPQPQCTPRPDQNVVCRAGGCAFAQHLNN